MANPKAALESRAKGSPALISIPAPVAPGSAFKMGNKHQYHTVKIRQPPNAT